MNQQPTKDELNNYFFNKASSEHKEKIEQWFLKHGRSTQAHDLLFSLWEEIESETGDAEESKAAFEIFKLRLTEKRELTKKVRRNKQLHIYYWMQRVAAILLLPILCWALYQYIENRAEKNMVWVEKNVGYGEIKNVTLPDGTTVWLNGGSKIVYPKQFKGDKRQVFFTGEGHFYVAKDAKKTFLLQVNETCIKVLGTQFNIRSYTEDATLEISLIEGAVAFNDLPDEKTERCRLLPGEQLQYHRTNGTLTKNHFEIDKYSSWKDGKYYFKNKTLEEITRQLERNFNVRIVIKTDSLRTIPYHMAFVNNETLDEMLLYMNIDGRVSIKRSKDLIEIY